MNSKNVNNYENVVIRKEQEIGINNFGLEYLVSLEQEIERLHSIIKEAREYLEETKISSQEVENEWAVDICDMVLEILDKAGSESNDS